MSDQFATANGETIIVNLTPTSVKMVPGATPVEVAARIQNAGAGRDEYTLTIEGLDASWYTIEDYKLRLSPGDELSVLFTLHPPKDSNPKPGAYTFTVSAHSKSDPAQVGRTKGVLEIGSKPLTLLLGISEVKVVAGDEPATIAATVSNNGSEIDQYAMTIAPLDPSWYTIDPESFRLFPGDKADITLKLHPPLDVNTRSGRYPFTVQASSLNKPELVSEASALVDVEAEGVDLILQPSSVQLSAEKPVSVSAVVTNTGAKIDQYTLEIDGVGSEWYKLGFQQISLLSGESKQVPVKLQPPEGGINAAQRIDFVVRARSRTHPNLVREAEGTLEVLVDPVSIKIEPAEVTVKPGDQPREVTLQLSNAGGTVDKYEIEIERIDPSWYTLDMKSVSLFPGQSRAVPLKLHPPRQSDIQAGQYTFAAVIVDNQRPVDKAEGVITIEPYMDFKVDIEPQRITGIQGTYELRLTNGGNYPIELALSGRDPDAILSYSFETEKPTVEPGDTTVVALTIGLKRPEMGEQGNTYQFTITARSTESDTEVGEEDLTHAITGELVYKDPTVEQRREEERRRAEEANRARLAAEAEQARLAEEQRMSEQKRQLESQQELQRRQAEAERQAREQREAEQARQAEEQRKSELARQQELARQSEQARKEAEQRQAAERQEAERRRAAQQRPPDQQPQAGPIQPATKRKSDLPVPVWQLIVGIVIGSFLLCALFIFISSLSNR
jgi:uncharacterized membrane protein